jgi:hypothetical protein
MSQGVAKQRMIIGDDEMRIQTGGHLGLTEGLQPDLRPEWIARKAPPQLSPVRRHLASKQFPTRSTVLTRPGRVEANIATHHNHRPQIQKPKVVLGEVSRRCYLEINLASAAS